MQCRYKDKIWTKNKRTHNNKKVKQFSLNFFSVDINFKTTFEYTAMFLFVLSIISVTEMINYINNPRKNNFRHLFAVQFPYKLRDKWMIIIVSRSQFSSISSNQSIYSKNLSFFSISDWWTKLVWIEYGQREIIKKMRWTSHQYPTLNQWSIKQRVEPIEGESMARYTQKSSDSNKFCNFTLNEYIGCIAHMCACVWVCSSHHSSSQ